MKAAMVFPTRESERAISGYSVTLTDNMKAVGVDIDNVTYTAGSPKTLFKQVSKLKKYDVVHIQHEYNLLGNYGLPFFALYFLLFLGNCRVVTTMHTILSQKEQFKGSKFKTFLRKMLYMTQNRVINWFSDVIVVHANFFKEILHHEYGIKKNKIIIFP
ncbi:glycosyltransferase, partial [Candidatus Pacearchaeota archaeon]|nr:glycosyltransferase [Candidatus Pacearchaeota archaeon]